MEERGIRPPPPVPASQGTSPVPASQGTTPVPSHCTRRACIVANSAYQDGLFGKLTNPVNDGKAMAAALGRMGFVVTLHLDVGIDAFSQAVRDFHDSIRAEDIALFFFSKNWSRKFVPCTIDFILQSGHEVEIIIRLF